MLLCRLFKAAAWLCLAFQLTWATAYFLTGSGLLHLVAVTPTYLSMANWLAVYLFIPLPAVLLVAGLCRSRQLLTGFLVAGSVFLAVWGWQYSPSRWPAQLAKSQSTETHRLKVMTYNVLAWHNRTSHIIQTIQHEDADIVFLQELNPLQARALQDRLSQEYPYQQLKPSSDDPGGSGLLSKYPLEPARADLPHTRWVGEPLAAKMKWGAGQVLLVNFHMASSTRFASWQAMKEDFKARNEQASLLVEYARSSADSPLGVIAAGDMNSVPLSDAYRLMTSTFQDAWAQTGFGLGNTFPGNNINNSPKPHLGFFFMPSWIVHLDYIFYTSPWNALASHTAQADGASDHRGVVAELINLP